MKNGLKRKRQKKQLTKNNCENFKNGIAIVRVLEYNDFKRSD